MKKTALIIPCYNEVARLRFFEYDWWVNRGIALFFVDDGSTDDTLKVIQKYASFRKKVYIIKLRENKGKAEAVRQGMLTAHRKKLGFVWYGFWDADLSAPPNQILPLIHCGYRENKIQPASIWGSRFRTIGSEIKRSSLRHFLGRIFSLAIFVYLRIRFYDTQCGAKLFNKRVIKKIFQKQFLTDWIFDLELYFRLIPDLPIECPLKIWHSRTSSKINFARLAYQLPQQLFLLKKTYLVK